jgi:hypothetical protein
MVPVMFARRDRGGNEKDIKTLPVSRMDHMSRNVLAAFKNDRPRVFRTAAN